MKYPKHVEGTDSCGGCEARLKECHQYMRDWFEWVKKAHSTVHVSWGFRDEQSQNDAFASGASTLRWPLSKHNRMNGNTPESAAIDIFEIINGVAKFDPILCAKIAEESADNGWGLRWGGTMKSLGDNNHFELPSTSPLMKLE